jgi:hypothetical protein
MQRLLSLLTGLLGLLLASQTVGAQERMRLGVNAFGYHDDPCRAGNVTIHAWPPTQALSEDWKFILEDAEAEFVLRQARVRQACALIHEGKRYVVLGNFGMTREEGDHDEVRGLELIILGHEIGHHRCGHTTGARGRSAWERELQADRYAGAIAAKLHRKGLMWDNPEEFLTVVGDSLVSQVVGGGSSSHPPAEMRAKAIRQGFYEGSDCITPTVATAPTRPSEPERARPNRTSYWDHNNSLMRLGVEGNTRRFFYERPRDALQRAGARSGALLFDGQTEGGRYWGTAHVFAGSCGTFPYEVSGEIRNDGRTVMMTGQAPRVDLNTCHVVGYRHDELVFEYKFSRSQ